MQQEEGAGIGRRVRSSASLTEDGRIWIMRRTKERRKERERGRSAEGASSGGEGDGNAL